jgi:hypothetical protein
LAIRHAMRVGSAWPPEKQPRADAYAEHKTVLPARLEQNAWMTVLGAYELSDDLNWQVREGMTGPLSDEDRSQFRAPWLAIREAEAVLGELDLSPKEASRLTASHRHATRELEQRYWLPSASSDDTPTR